MNLKIGDRLLNESAGEELLYHMEHYYSDMITLDSFPFDDVLQLVTEEELFSAIIDLEDFEILREYIEDYEDEDNIKIRYYLKPGKQKFNDPHTLMFHLEREINESIYV